MTSLQAKFQENVDQHGPILMTEAVIKAVFDHYLDQHPDELELFGGSRYKLILYWLKQVVEMN